MEGKKQIEILKGLSYRKKAIARELKLSKNTVKSYLAKSEEEQRCRKNNRKEALLSFFPYVQE
jgi:DNA-binding NarL/FixJ family response regulator